MTYRCAALRGSLDQKRRWGVSLIEVMISLVLVSTILLVSLSASGNLLRNDVQRRGANQGQLLAAQLLDEVSSLDFRDRIDPIHGLESDEDVGDRESFDDVDDYDGYAAAPPTHRDGSTISGYAGWSFAVTVTPADPDATGITTTAADETSPLRIISVVCTTPTGTTVQASSLVSNVPDNTTQTDSYERWRRLRLTFPDREINVTAPLRNNPDSSN